MKIQLFLLLTALSAPVFAQYGVPTNPPGPQDRRVSPNTSPQQRPQAQPQPQYPTQSNDSRALDAAVRAALARNDLSHAKSLAVTAEHWAWIQDAQNPKNASGGGKSYGDYRSDMANSPQCASARRSYEIESGAFKPNYAAIEAKRAGMSSACGLAY